MDYSKFESLICETYPVEKNLFNNLDVKRGLRNSDGSGVLAGLTRVSSVIGYKKGDKGIIPVEGVLRYRGIDINDIVNALVNENRDGFEEVSYLLLFGKLPTTNELESFKQLLDEYLQLPEGFEELILRKSTSKDVMNKLARSVLALYSYDDNPDNVELSNSIKQCIELIARFPSLLAYCYQAVAHYSNNKSLYIHYPDKNIGVAKNFLRLIRANQKFTELEARTLDVALVLHAEHGGGNNSSFTSHVVSSSGTDIYSSTAASIGSLKGPKHGGASLRVAGMIENIKDNVSRWDNVKDVSEYVSKILRKETQDKSGLIYGIGHAVYTKSDPRAKILKNYAQQLAKEKNREKEFILYDIIETVTPNLFKEIKNSDKVISANVDFYSGFVYNLLEIPPVLNTPIFAMARVVGWSAHRLEELIVGDRIIRPAYKSVEGEKIYEALSNR